MTITQRFATMLGVVFLCLVVLAGVFIQQMGRVYDSANFSNTNLVPSILVLDDATRAFGKMRVRLYRYVLNADSTSREGAEESIWEAQRELKDALKAYQKMINNEQDLLLLTATNDLLTGYLGQVDSVVEASKAQRNREAREMLASSMRHAEAVNAALDEHAHYNRLLGQQYTDEGLVTKRNAVLMLLVLGACLLIVVYTLSYQFTRSLARAMQHGTAVVTRIRRGDLGSPVIIQGDDETAEMLASLQAMQTSLAQTVDQFRGMVSAAALQGDFSVRLPIEGKEGYVAELAELLNQLAAVAESGLNDSIRVARAMATGDLGQSVQHKHPGRFGKLIDALMELQNVSAELETQRWAKDQIAALLTRLQQADTPQEFAATLLSQLATSTGAVQGLLWVDLDGSGYLRNVGSHGCPLSDQILGEGQTLVGQCAKDKLPVSIHDPVGTALRLQSGLVDGPAKHLVLLPLVHRRYSIGVAELAFAAAPNRLSQHLLDAIPTSITPALEVMRRNLGTERLAFEIQQQAGALQQSEASLRETLTMMKEILAAATGIAIIGVTRAGEINLFNKGAESLLGWKADEVVDREYFYNLRAGKPGDPDPAEAQRAEEFLAMVSGIQSVADSMEHQCRFRRRDGSAFEGTLMVTPVFAANDEIKGYLCVVQDVTERQEIEWEMKQARHDAEEASRMKSDFLANMSHEIRTPMNGIIGMTHLVMHTEMTAQQHEYLRKIQMSGQHLLRIINDILDLSKIEAGKLAIESAEFELETMLAGVVNVVADKAEEKGLELLLDVANDVPVNVIGDSLRIGQVLINYTNNAVKFTERGGVDIQVRVRERSEKNVLLWFGVRDTGIGIDDAVKGRLFEAFTQGDSTTTRRFGGTGLGLAISKRLTTLMGGEVGVESQPGQGSSFWFTARLGIGQAERRALLPAVDLRGRRVLVVDDNANARQVMSEMLSGMSFIVDTVASGAEAVAAVRHQDSLGQAYDLVVMDWRMPGLNGVETGRQIIRQSLAEPPRLLLVTAYGREDVFHQAKEAGIRDVLVKPLNASVLFDNVIRILRNDGNESGPEGRVPEESPAALQAIAGARILVVEDNPVNQEVMIELLRHAHFEVDLAENGRIALSRVETFAYDLVLMDMQMPVMGGVEATREIMRSPGGTKPPIVAMTANAMASDREECLNAGMCDFLSKPIEPDLLWQVLVKWIAPRRSASRLAVTGDIAVAPAPTFDPGVADIDVPAALRRLMGNEALYIRSLRHFCDRQADTAESVRRALDADDAETARRLAHSLKGVAGSIGANALASRAAALEAAIASRMTRHRIDAEIDALNSDLSRLVADLSSQLPPESTGDPAVPASLDEFEQLLEDSDPEALGWLLAHRSSLRDQLPEAACNEIDSAVRGFDLEVALRRLKDARQKEERT